MSHAKARKGGVTRVFWGFSGREGHMAWDGQLVENVVVTGLLGLKINSDKILTNIFLDIPQRQIAKREVSSSGGGSS